MRCCWNGLLHPVASRCNVRCRAALREAGSHRRETSSRQTALPSPSIMFSVSAAAHRSVRPLPEFCFSCRHLQTGWLSAMLLEWVTPPGFNHSVLLLVARIVRPTK